MPRLRPTTEDPEQTLPTFSATCAAQLQAAIHRIDDWTAALL